MDHVRDYWFSVLNLTDEKISNKYIERLKEDKIEMFIILENSLKIGYIQTYILNNTEIFGIQGLSKGIDIFIGERKMLGKGFGPDAIKKLLIEYVFDEEAILYACIDPEVRNVRAIKAYEKIGFKHVRTAKDENSNLETYYMILEREDFFAI